MSRVIVTGAAGFLGSHLVRAFRDRGDTVDAIVREPTDASSGALAMESVLADPDRALGGAPIDVLVHAAAVRHRHGVDTQTYKSSNVDLFERLVTALASRVRRFVLVSSVGVYGFPRALPILEDHPRAPRTLYSATKVHAEARARELAAKHGFELVIVRPTIMYGVGDRNGMLDKMAGMIGARRYLLVGSGNNVLHHTHIDDVVAGILLAGDAKAAAGEDFILAGPETTTLAALSQLCARVLGVTLPKVHIPLGFARAVATTVDIAAYRGWAFSRREPPINNEKLDVMTVPIAFDATKARVVLGFTPRIGYEEGVRRTLGPKRDGG